MPALATLTLTLTRCLLGYSDDRDPTLLVVARGEGAAEEMAPHLSAGACLYALVRVTQRIDASVTVKLACYTWEARTRHTRPESDARGMRGSNSPEP